MIFSEFGKIIVALPKRQKTQTFQKKKDCIAEKTEIIEIALKLWKISILKRIRIMRIMISEISVFSDSSVIKISKGCGCKQM